MHTSVSLDGIWKFVTDLDPRYHSNKRCYPVTPFFAKEGINRRHWKDVPVPGCWQKYEERLSIHEGVCWYARTFALSSLTEGERVFLRFGAVNYACKIYVNGAEASSHECGYTPFSVEITAFVREGENLLVVSADNRDSVTVWPCDVGYFPYGGIHRSVMLERITPGDLTELYWDAAWTDTGAVLTLHGRTEQNLPTCLTLRCGGSEKKYDVTGKFSVSLAVPGAAPWSPESPKLYEASVTAANGDTRSCRVGFKRLRIENGVPCLNGEPFRFKGVCYVPDYSTTGMTQTRENVLRDLTLMKNAGVNAVRCHYAMDEVFYTLCDEMGLAVWIEPNVYCYHPANDQRNTFFTDDHARRLAFQMGREMAEGGRNHVCVSVYGIGNECNNENPESEEFFRTLAGVIRQTDPTRLVSYAVLYGMVGAIGDAVDIVGINSYWGWYDKLDMAPDTDAGKTERQPGRPEPIDLAPFHAMMREVLAKLPPEKPLLLTEFGADSVPGFLSASRELWSEDYHADLIRDTISASSEYGRIFGTFVFAFTDYHDPSKDFNGYWNEYNLKGMVDYARNIKKPYTALCRCYGGKE